VSPPSRIVLLGPPASGKGTLAAILSKALNIPTVSTGALLREEKVRESEIGIEAASWTDRGLLFPDELALRVVRAWLDENGLRFLFDGFPRTRSQAEAFDQELEKRSVSIDAVVDLELSEEEIRARVQGRLTCPDCGKTFQAGMDGMEIGTACDRCCGTLQRREDDDLEVLEKRLVQHHKLAGPLLEYYDQRGLLLRMDASGGTNEVFERLTQTLSVAA